MPRETIPPQQHVPIAGTGVACNHEPDGMDASEDRRGPPDPHRKRKPTSDKRTQARTEKLLEAAVDVFLEKGYRNARLNDIVARAGGSMATLYRIFNDKEGLARAIMQRHVHTLDDCLRSLDAPELSPTRALHTVARRLVDALLAPGAGACLRIAVAEGEAPPELREWFLAHAFAPARRRLADYLDRQRATGRLRLESASIAAGHFHMLVCGELMLCMTNRSMTPTEHARLHGRTRQAVELFLHGALPR